MRRRRVMALVELETHEPLRVLRSLLRHTLAQLPGSPDVLRLVQLQLNVIREPEPKRKPRRVRRR